ncbi:hypothetical protein DSM100238_0521 [Bifidobacterium apri]|uniref:Uncharacterized protein n=1 Tax=Bifidobacterium apri TaxID=1769423 RepID=A0A6A2WFZ1_9BIFI|nr:hypothetical protein DSM100238_0521 [Bifidobacterium apri]
MIEQGPRVRIVRGEDEEERPRPARAPTLDVPGVQDGGLGTRPVQAQACRAGGVPAYRHIGTFDGDAPEPGTSIEWTDLHMPVFNT